MHRREFEKARTMEVTFLEAFQSLVSAAIAEGKAMNARQYIRATAGLIGFRKSFQEKQAGTKGL